MTRLQIVTIAAALSLAACGDDTGTEVPAADAATNVADAAGQADAATAADAAPEPDADLSDHGFVTVDGTEIAFEEVVTYVNDMGIGDVTLNASIGPDCPLGSDCTTLYVTVPGDAELGAHDCDEIEVGVQLNEAGGERFFSFGSDSAGCSFRLTAFGTESGQQVAVEGLSALLEANLDPTSRRLLSDGELRATMP